MTEKFTAARVLIVDDEGLIRWALRRALIGRGASVEEAVDARTAMLAASQSETPFDAVVLDLKLPDSDDLGLLSTLRRQLPAARIIVMTAFGSEETCAEALRLGAFRVVQKPFDVKSLAAEVLGGQEGAQAPGVS